MSCQLDHPPNVLTMMSLLARASVGADCRGLNLLARLVLLALLLGQDRDASILAGCKSNGLQQLLLVLSSGADVGCINRTCSLTKPLCFRVSLLMRLRGSRVNLTPLPVLRLTWNLFHLPVAHCLLAFFEQR
jgi:hypothetical protein